MAAKIISRCILSLCLATICQAQTSSRSLSSPRVRRLNLRLSASRFSSSQAGSSGGDAGDRKCVDPFNTDRECNPGQRSFSFTPLRLPNYPYVVGSGLPRVTPSTDQPVLEVEVERFQLLKPQDYPTVEELNERLNEVGTGLVNRRQNSSDIFKPQSFLPSCLCSCDPNPPLGESGCHDNATRNTIKPFEGYNSNSVRRHIVQLEAWGIVQTFDVVRCRSGSSCEYGGGECEQVQCSKPLITYHDGMFDVEMFRYSACCSCRATDFSEFVRNKLNNK